jgi:hypothetical protein
VKRGCFVERLVEWGEARLEELAGACGLSGSHAYRLARYTKLPAMWRERLMGLSEAQAR